MLQTIAGETVLTWKNRECFRQEMAFKGSLTPRVSKRNPNSLTLRDPMKVLVSHWKFPLLGISLDGCVTRRGEVGRGTGE